MIRRRLAALLLAGVALVACAHAMAAAQDKSGTALQGLSPNRDQPVKIESSALEVRDKQRQATFTGDVKLVQGDTTLKCKVLVVFYEDTAASPGKKAPAQAGGPGGGGGQQIKRAEARGDVFITQKDQTASGDNGVFDLKANTVVLTGNVVVTQGQSVMRGKRMVVELGTGVVRVESERGSGPVEMIMGPGVSAPKDVKSAPPAPAPAAKSVPRTPGAPIKIN